MTGKKQFYFILIIFLILCSRCYGEEEKKEKSKSFVDSIDMSEVQKHLENRNNKPVPKMKVIKPGLNIDKKIVKNNYDSGIDYKLKIFNPGTGKENNCKSNMLKKFKDQDLWEKSREASDKK